MIYPSIELMWKLYFINFDHEVGKTFFQNNIYIFTGIKIWIKWNHAVSRTASSFAGGSGDGIEAFNCSAEVKPRMNFQ